MTTREIIFISLVGFILAWSVLSAYGLFQALAGFTDTYADLVSKYPTLATAEARQATLQSIIFHEVAKWAIVTVPLALLALMAKW
jgi:hypothetical protein